MDIIEKEDEPTLFISRTGASKVGLKLLAKLPKAVSKFKVLGPVSKADTKGYHLMVYSKKPNVEPRRLTYSGLDLLL